MPCVLVRSGGNTASGVALRLHQVGFPVIQREEHHCGYGTDGFLK